MTGQDLLDELEKTLTVHPELKEAHVWFYSEQGEPRRIRLLGVDKRHKPARIKLYD